MNYSDKDFVKSDQTYLKSAKFAQHEAYWLKKYKQLPKPLIPSKYIGKFAGKIIPNNRSTLILKRKFYDQLLEFAATQKVSIFHIFIGALYCYFTRITEREDFAIGLPTLNHNTANFKHTVELFTGVVPAWFRCGTALSFSELIKEISAELHQVYRYQHFPIGELNKKVGLHQLGQKQLFDIMLSYEKYDYDVKPSTSLTSTIDLEKGVKQIPLEISINEFHQHEDVHIDIHYNLNAFEESDIKLFKTRFCFLLGEILKQPDIPVSTLKIIPPTELNKLLVEFNDTTVNYSLDKTVIDLFEEQVEKTPDHIALVFEDTKLTYCELNKRANQLAHYLRKLGVKEESLVGIYMERSFPMIVGIIGILKAGGAYIPIDHAYPAERLVFILDDAQVSIVLTQKNLQKNLPKTPILIVCIDIESKNFSKYPSENPNNNVRPKNLMYVIYTSGSTGRPKGVLITHNNVARLFTSTHSWFHFCEKDVWTFFHSYAFDFSVWELWGALLYGGRLIIVPYWISRSPEAFYELLCTQKVTILNQTPSAFRQLMRVEEQKKNYSNLNLKFIIFGGEALEFHSLKEWFEQHDDKMPKLINMYGITETTVHVTYYPVIKADLNKTGSIVGIPIPDLQVYILDSYLNPTPIGIPGELHIGGVGLARGYLNRPELTKEKFIPHPFSDDSNARLYKTGDLAQYLPDGNIEYLGRIDHQVKIRGFRIELGEIESILMQHPEIKQAVVVAKENELGNKRLIAYMLSNDEKTTLAILQRDLVHNLRYYLQDKLPTYMVPEAFVLLENFPLTPNGKIDRNALPKPERKHLSIQELVKPRNDTERLLVTIWKKLLALTEVGINDNFFEVGGHSLLAIQLISRIRDECNVELSLKQVFEESTIAKIAAIITEQQLAQADSDDLADILAEIDELSDEEVEQMLNQK